MSFLKIVIALWIIPQFSFFQQNGNKEQIVFDYFINNVFYKEYPDIKRVEFSGYTEGKMSKVHVEMCFANSEKLRYVIDSTASQKVLSKIKIDYTKVKNIAIKQYHPKSRQTKILVLQTTPVDKHHYIVIQVYKPYHFVEHYLFELDNHDNVMRWCKTGEII